MDFITQLEKTISDALSGISGVMDPVLFSLRIVILILFVLVVWFSFSSMLKARRQKDPVIILEDPVTHTKIPVLYWENSVGRSKACDICIPDATVSRNHAVLMRREQGWVVADTNSKAGTMVNGVPVNGMQNILPGDLLTFGGSSLQLSRAQDVPERKKNVRRPPLSRTASPASLMALASLTLFLILLQCCCSGEGFTFAPVLLFLVLLVLGWGFYVYSRRILKRVSFELETIGFLLSGTGIMLLCGTNVSTAVTQTAGLFLGMVLFCFLIWFMGDLERVKKWRIVIGVAGLALFALTVVFGSTINGAQNWIIIGPVSIQPAELVKIAFIFAGASALDKLQTAKNLTEFILFAAACIGFLFFMHDFGGAVLFFAVFLIIAFMRSGSVRTVALVCAAAAIGLFLILKFKPYVAERFSGWGHVWQHVNDSFGYQQTRVLTYSASGGFFGLGIGNGCLKYVFAADSDLVFGMLCEELGILFALAVVFTIASLTVYSLLDVRRCRSTFYSISSCAAAGLLLFQTCVNLFGATDIFPLTGVTLPFISAGGTSMVAVWGLLAFIKAADERTYAARRVRE